MGSDLGNKQNESFSVWFSKKLNIFLLAVVVGLCLHIRRGRKIVVGLAGKTTSNASGGNIISVEFGDSL